MSSRVAMGRRTDVRSYWRTPFQKWLGLAVGLTIPHLAHAASGAMPGDYHALSSLAIAQMDSEPWESNWSVTDLTAVTQSPPAFTRPTGFVMAADNTQHVFYRDAYAHIQELWWWSNRGWSNDDVTQQTNAPRANGGPSGYMFEQQATQHVDYRDINHHVQELWHGDSWNNDDLTQQANAPPAAGDPVGFLNNGVQHVIYRDMNGNIQDLTWHQGWNTCRNLMQATSAPPAIGNPVGFVYENAQHVVYRDINRHIEELFRMGSDQWQNNDLTGLTNAPLATSDPAACVFLAHDSQLIIYRDVFRHIQQLWWRNGSWHRDDLTQLSKVQLANAGAPGCMIIARGREHAIFRDINNHIQVLSVGGYGWHNHDVTKAIGAPLACESPVAYVSADQNSLYILYRDFNNHIQQLAWQGQ